MERFARNTTSSNIEIIPIGRPFSNFTFVEGNFGGIRSLRRIFSQIRALGGQTMTMEILNASEELKEEDEDIKIRYSQFSKGSNYRLGFFSKKFKTNRGLKLSENDDFLGYAIIRLVDLPGIRNTPWIYESVVRPIRHTNNFIHGMKHWNCSIAEKVFEVAGHLYAQQNNMTNCCAHVALRSAAAAYHQDGNRLIGK